jgi:CheY-like chemotaxis protein
VPAKPADDTPRRLHKNPEAIAQFLDRLDESSAVAAAVNARRSDRYRYRVHPLVLELEQAGTGWVRYEVPSRNLSREGAAFLLGHFVYPGTTCRVHLLSLQDQLQIITARVIRCRYLEGSGTLHEVGVSFDRAIDVAMFNQRAARLRFLLVNQDPSMHRLIGHFLKSLDVELTHVESGRKAVDMATAAQFDLVLLDTELPDSAGTETARELRRRGFARAIVALTATAGDEHREEILAAGCNRHLTKPISREDLAHVVESLKEKPHFSSMADDADFIELIDTFVTELPEKVGQLEIAFSQNDYSALTTAARVLKGEGGAYGFQTITDAAAGVEEAISNSGDAAEIRGQLDELIRICLSARSTGSCVGAAPPA